MPTYKIGQDTLSFDNDNDAINYANHIGAPSPIIDNQKSYSLSQDEHDDLIRNLHNVGYSGLDKRQQEQYNQQFPYSDWAKADPKRTLRDAQMLADKQAGITLDDIKKLPIKTNQLLRDGLAYPMGTITGALEKGAQYIPVIGESTPKEKSKSVGEYISENIKRGKEDVGVTGTLSSPISDALILASVLSGPINPILAAAINGIGSAVQYGLESEKPTLKGAGITAGIGALLGGGAEATLGKPASNLATKNKVLSELAEKSAENLDRTTATESIISDLTEKEAKSGLGKNIPSDEAKNIYNRKLSEYPKYSDSDIKKTEDNIKSLEKQIQKEVNVNPEKAKELNEKLVDIQSLHESKLEKKKLAEDISLLYGASAELDQKINLGIKKGINKEKLNDLRLEKAKLDKKISDKTKKSIYPGLDFAKDLINRGMKPTIFGALSDKLKITSPILEGKYSKVVIPKTSQQIGRIGSILATQPISKDIEKVDNKINHPFTIFP